MVFHYTKLEAKAKRQRKGLCKVLQGLSFDCRENQTKNNSFGIHPSIYFTNSHYLHGTLLGVMGKPFEK